MLSRRGILKSAYHSGKHISFQTDNHVISEGPSVRTEANPVDGLIYIV